MGKDCVSISTDLRLGREMLTVSTEFQKVFKINKKLYVALCGLATDVQTVLGKLRTIHKLYRLKEGRNMSPRVFTFTLANLLYSRRFGPYFIDPIIAGLDHKNNPFVATMDSIGAIDIISEGFACVGTTGSELTGIAEVLWKKNMNSDELPRVSSQILISATNRDCLAGWGAEIIIIEPSKVTRKLLKSRQD